MSERVYADYNASAPVRPEARAAVAMVLDLYGNPSSAHREGVRLRRLIEEARESVATLLGRRPRDVVFTSGATEANGAAIAGMLRNGDRLLTSPIEHASILAAARRVAEDGVALEMLPVTRKGRILVDAGRTPRATLASLCLANGEVGSVLPADAVGALSLIAEWVHLDVTQAVGRIALPETGDTVILSLSAHKLGGIGGVGALVIPESAPFRSSVVGGEHERGRRAGTENVPGIVAFGAVARALAAEAEEEAAHVRLLRDRLWARLLAGVPGIFRNGPPLEDTLPNTLNVTVPGISGEALLVHLDLAGIAASLGSACAAGSPEPSHVLRAMGRDDVAARAGLRLSFGWATTEADVERVATVLVDIARERGVGSAA